MPFWSAIAVIVLMLALISLAERGKEWRGIKCDMEREKERVVDLLATVHCLFSQSSQEAFSPSRPCWNEGGFNQCIWFGPWCFFTWLLNSGNLTVCPCPNCCSLCWCPSCRYVCQVQLGKSWHPSHSGFFWSVFFFIRKHHWRHISSAKCLLGIVAHLISPQEGWRENKGSNTWQVSN